MGGAKDDRRDAFVLADSLHTDQPCFRRVRLDDPQVIQLRELSRVDEDLQREGNQLANRLRDQLHRFYMQALKLCPAADEPWLWTLLELAPSPSVARRLRPKRVERLLRAHRIRRLKADEVVSALRMPAQRFADRCAASRLRTQRPTSQRASEKAPAAGTVNHEMMVLKHMMRRAVEWEYRGRNPFLDAQARPLRGVKALKERDHAGRILDFDLVYFRGRSIAYG